jgi:hypothetical protein
MQQVKSNRRDVVLIKLRLSPTFVGSVDAILALRAKNWVPSASGGVLAVAFGEKKEGALTVVDPSIPMTT